MKLRVVGKIIVSLIPAIIGTILLIGDKKNQIAHPEWSASPAVMWIKFAVFCALSIVLFVILFRVWKGR